MSWGFPWESTFLAPLEEHPPDSCINTYRPQRCTILISFRYCLSAPSFQCIHTFPFLPYPCVLSEGGRQFKITPGDLIVVNRLTAKIGMCIFLDKVRAVIAERRERSETNNRVLFKIPRYLYIYIYIYMSVCKCIVQERAHLTQVLSRQPLCIWNTGCCSAHYFEESPIR